MDNPDAKTAGPLIDERAKLEALDNEVRIERFGWDELTVEQKIERIRRIVKGIEANSNGQWSRLQQFGEQMRHHSHGSVTGVVLMPLDGGAPGFGVTEAEMPGGKVYF